MTPDVSQVVEAVYRADSRRVLATLIRLLGDFSLAEDAMQEAFAAATSVWQSKGVPDDPVAWLISTGRFKAIDLVRRESRFYELQPALVARLEAVATRNSAAAQREIEDDRLRLIFTCCHSAIDPNVQVALTLREVCGLSTPEIADAFLTAPATMAQRIVRGKAKIRLAGIPYVVPSLEDLPERLDAVLKVIYLVFNEGYAASTGASLTRAELSGEAIRLGRLLLELLPDPEAMGLLALMLLHESRRESRIDSDGDLIVLEDQNRQQWDRKLIAEGQHLLHLALGAGRFGPYCVQAAISAVHAEAATAAATDWRQIVALYDVLLRIDPSPVVELNRAVSKAMLEGPDAGLRIIDAILGRGELTNYHRAHAARGELLRRSGKLSDARRAFQRALTLVKQDSERRFLAKRLASLKERPPAELA